MSLPAVYYGMKEIEREFGPSTVAVLPSDHLVHSGPAYVDTFRKAESLAEEWLVLFGIAGTTPHTGFGYIRPGRDLPGAFTVAAVPFSVIYQMVNYPFSAIPDYTFQVSEQTVESCSTLFAINGRRVDASPFSTISV